MMVYIASAMMKLVVHAVYIVWLVFGLWLSSGFCVIG
jgi:hypothetical protein